MEVLLLPVSNFQFPISRDGHIQRFLNAMISEKAEAEANAERWKEKCDTKHEGMIWHLSISNTLVKDVTAQRLMLIHKKEASKVHTSQLCEGNQGGTMGIQTARQLVGRKIALQDTEHNQLDVFTAIERAHLHQIQSIRDTEYNRGLKYSQSTHDDEGGSQVLSTTAVMWQELPSSPSQDKEPNLHKKIETNSTELEINAPDRPEHPLVQLTPVPRLFKSFNVEYELGPLPQSPGCKIIPSRLA
ncbi:hypothetical protein ACHAP3_006442 [Botrytis cinerea]